MSKKLFVPILPDAMTEILNRSNDACVHNIFQLHFTLAENKGHVVISRIINKEFVYLGFKKCSKSWGKSDFLK